jgi:pyruvate dehydrogenase E2 component (dihydrolipoamide acetyltransferase)
VSDPGSALADFRMPSLGAEMEDGTVLEWRVQAGDVVARGDIVALIDTEKAEIEVETFLEGRVESILVPVGAKVPVGTVLATIATGAPARGFAAQAAHPPEPVTRPPESVTRAPEPELVTRAPAAVRGPEPAPAGEGRPRVSPLARRLAGELAVDLARIEGRGEGGAITRADVERAARARAPAPAAGAPARPPRVTPPPEGAARDRGPAMRRVIAAAMARSKREIPHYYLGNWVDLGAALAWLEAENAKRRVTERLLPAALLLKAVGLSLRDVPELNGFFQEGELRRSERVHLGVAISLREGGLVAPAIHDADRKTPDEIMGELRDLVRRARSFVLRSSEVSDPTITVTNLGDQGVETVFGVIYPPQVALVGFGKIVERPWAAAGMIGVRRAVHVSLSADHRASDGHRGGLFLTALERWLRDPAKLGETR